MIWIIIINYLIRSGKLKQYSLPVARVFSGIRPGFIKPASAIMVSLMLASGAYSKDLLPVPAGVPNQLFYLQRDPDENTVIYKLNLINGSVNTEQPVHAYWIRYAEKGQVRELSALQRKLAYGIRSRLIDPGKFELRLVSYPQMPLYLVSGPNHNYYVYAVIGQRTLILNRVFVSVNSGGLFLPKVSRIELTGKDLVTGKDMKHTIHI